MGKGEPTVTQNSNWKNSSYYYYLKLYYFIYAGGIVLGIFVLYEIWKFDLFFSVGMIVFFFAMFAMLCIIASLPIFYLIHICKLDVEHQNAIMSDGIKYQGTILMYLQGCYRVVVEKDGKRYYYQNTLSNSHVAIDHDLAFVYMREDKDINVLVKRDDMRQGMILYDEYFRKQEARNISRIRCWDHSFKYHDLHTVKDNQIKIIGKMLKKETRCVDFSEPGCAVIFYEFQTIVSYFDDKLGQIFHFKALTYIPLCIFANYSKYENNNRDIPVEVIVDRNDFSKYIVLIDKALEENFGTTRM